MTFVWGRKMRRVELDLSKLLGFRAIRHSLAALGAKAGTKTGTKIGTKVGTKIGLKVGVKG